MRLADANTGKWSLSRKGLPETWKRKDGSQIRRWIEETRM
jgi:uncharacterized protein YaeQ